MNQEIEQAVMQYVWLETQKWVKENSVRILRRGASFMRVKNNFKSFWVNFQDG